jgi:mannose-1-phosphate guanylyltransferase
MGAAGSTWTIVLAGGEGSRLRSLTTTALGVAIPKQFCSLHGGDSLLHDALRRAESIATPDHICAVVSLRHRRWWESALAGVAPANVIVQPRSCGTANGILLPLLCILERDSEARVVILPSDHHVRQETVLAAALQRGVQELSARRDQVLLMGILPQEADPDLGYIVPGPGDGAVSAVDRFVEKPDAALAHALVDHGALWNAFIVAAKGTAILRMFTERFPRVVESVRQVVAQNQFTQGQSAAALDLYRGLPDIDFSRQILQGAEPVLRVMQVPRCGWSDLGTPKRLAKTLQTLPQSLCSPSEASHRAGGFLNLALQQARLRPAVDHWTNRQA